MLFLSRAVCSEHVKNKDRRKNYRKLLWRMPWVRRCHAMKQSQQGANKRIFFIFFLNNLVPNSFLNVIKFAPPVWMVCWLHWIMNDDLADKCNGAVDGWPRWMSCCGDFMHEHYICWIWSSLVDSIRIHFMCMYLYGGVWCARDEATAIAADERDSINAKPGRVSLRAFSLMTNSSPTRNYRD